MYPEKGKRDRRVLAVSWHGLHLFAHQPQHSLTSHSHQACKVVGGHTVLLGQSCYSQCTATHLRGTPAAHVWREPLMWCQGADAPPSLQTAHGTARAGQKKQHGTVSLMWWFSMRISATGKAESATCMPWCVAACRQRQVVYVCCGAGNELGRRAPYASTHRTTCC